MAYHVTWTKRLVSMYPFIRIETDLVLICLYFCQKGDEYSLFNFRDSRVPLFGDGFCEDKDVDMKDEETKAKQKTEDESKKSTEDSE